jgi:putative tryptophan/tyrosine transport system substrate-binding protein
MRRIGVLIAGSENDPEEHRSLRALFQGLQDLGWQPGINLQIAVRYGGGQPERIAAAAKELVAAQLAVLEVETTPGTAAVLKETHTSFLSTAWRGAATRLSVRAPPPRS